MIAKWFTPANERALWCGIVATIVTALAAHVMPTRFNSYVLLADALVHGHLWIARPSGSIDAVLFNEHFYIINDPVPALLLVPAVAIFGLGTNQTMLAVFMGGIAAGLGWLLAERLDVAFWPRATLSVFLFAGTDLWWCAAIGDVWFLAQVCAVVFVLAALCELARERPRGWIVGLGFVLAAGSRFTLVMALPVVAYLVARGDLGHREPAPGARERLAGFATVIAVFFGIWAAYNHARWGVFWDRGHTIFYHEDRLGQPTGLPFSLANVPNQISSFFFAPPIITNRYPYIVLSLRGTALTWTSPALAFAFVARSPRRSVVAMWCATILVATPSFLYYVNGFTQYGMRHALDFEPFLFVLMLLASRKAFPRWVTLAAAWSIAASAYGLWFWQTFAQTQP